MSRRCSIHAFGRLMAVVGYLHLEMLSGRDLSLFPETSRIFRLERSPMESGRATKALEARRSSSRCSSPPMASGTACDIQRKLLITQFFQVVCSVDGQDFFFVLNCGAKSLLQPFIKKKDKICNLGTNYRVYTQRTGNVDLRVAYILEEDAILTGHIL